MPTRKYLPVSFFSFQLCPSTDGKKDPRPIAYGQIKAYDAERAREKILNKHWSDELEHSGSLPALWLKKIDVHPLLRQLIPGQVYLHRDPIYGDRTMTLISLSKTTAQCQLDDGRFLTVPGIELQGLPCIGRFHLSEVQLREIARKSSKILASMSAQDLREYSEW